MLFTDESKFNLFGSGGRVNVWRQSNTELELKHLRPTVKHGGGSVLVWGCMSAANVGKFAVLSSWMELWINGVTLIY